ncbi:hypothetical protein C8F01DRAFT_1081944 [Mycena amicta]|nr:hypothetical protein C8F01DRAFT_1081944 [Mycena amicta]
MLMNWHPWTVPSQRETERDLPPRTDKSAATLTKENDRLTRQLNTAQSNINELARQLKDAQGRHHQTAERDAVPKGAVSERREELCLVPGYSRKRQTAEKRSAEEQVEYWRRQADDRILEVQKRDQEIAKLTQQVQDLQYEIGVERERSQKAAARNPQSGPARSRGPNAVLGSDDPKHAELIKFYEDITNTLVTDIKIQEPTYFGLNEWNLTCIYTYADKLGSDESKRREPQPSSAGLGFLLRLTHEVADDSESEPETSDELERRIQYTPLDLDKESPDFVTALQFLNTGFTFPRRQLPLFFISLVDNMKRACGPEMQEPEQEESMEEEE